MKKWEYTEKVIHFDEDIVKAANEYGQKSWELVSVLTAFHGLNRSLIFKREIPQTIYPYFFYDDNGKKFVIREDGGETVLVDD